MDEISDEEQHFDDMVLPSTFYQPTNVSIGKAVNIPSNGYILDLTVVYDKSMVEKFGSNGAKTR